MADPSKLRLIWFYYPDLPASHGSHPEKLQSVLLETQHTAAGPQLSRCLRRAEHSVQRFATLYSNDETHAQQSV